MSELNDLVRFESYYMLIQTRKHIEISSKYRFFPIEEILEEDSPKKALLAGLIGGS